MKNTKVIAISIPVDLDKKLTTIYMESDIRVSKSRFISNIIEEYIEDFELFNTKGDEENAICT